MPSKKPKFNIIKLAKPYKYFIFGILILSLTTNGLNLIIPKIVAEAIDTFRTSNFSIENLILTLGTIAICIFILSTLQSVSQTYLSERIAKDLRTQLLTKISKQQFSFIAEVTPEKLLTNLTSDVDNIKQVISQGIITIFSSIVIVFGASFFLLSINFSLGLIVLTIIPLIVSVFYFIFSRIKKYFIISQSIIDKLNKTINESIIASSLIRIVNSQSVEFEKFSTVGHEARNVGLSILKLFSSLIPLIGIIANLSIVAIILLGGNAIVNGTFTIGGLSAFISYISMLIFPIIVIGFISNGIARAAVSYERISVVLDSEIIEHFGNVEKPIDGKISFKSVNLTINKKEILKNISFEIKPHSRTAILGPTAAGKTQIFYLISGLLQQTSGEILIDDLPLGTYSQKSIADQIGLVFQDSSIFNTTIMENINFRSIDRQESLTKAIETAALGEFIENLDNGIETNIAERGTSLSGGQKQRITLARALVLEPQILLLDDFTARVDKETEKNIFKNLNKNYKDLTLVLITQQISSIIDFDQIILVMEGEVLAIGTHNELLKSSIEYEQIFNSQKSIS